MTIYEIIILTIISVLAPFISIGIIYTVAMIIFVITGMLNKKNI